MQPPESLSALQAWMQRAITHPRGIFAGATNTSIDDTIAPSARQLPAERLAIYERAYFARLIGCLRSMFPALLDALDEPGFEALAVAYLEAHPPQSYTLDDLADQFADFLQATRPPRTSSTPDEFDFLIDLARLEHAIDVVFSGPGSEELPKLTIATLQTLTPESFAEAKLTLAPELKLLTFGFAINDYYTHFRQATQYDLPAPLPEPTFLALHRHEYIVRRLPLTAAGYQALTALVGGETVAEALVRGAGEYRGPADEYPLVVQSWFRDWAAAGLFLGVD